MPFKVRVQNYQSIRDAIIEVEGFTVVTGANNTGKSALLRAIRGLFVNAKGHAFVRHGNTSTKVSLIFDDGQQASWEKGPKINSYTINGQRLNKVGSSAPEELNVLGVVPVSLSTGVDVWPQFAPQFTGQTFLLDQPGSVLAEVISDVEKVAVLNKAKMLAEQDVRQAQSAIKIRASDLEYTENALRTFDGLNDCEQMLLALDQTKEALQQLQDTISWLRVKSTALLSARGAESMIRQRLEILQKLPSSDLVSDLQESQTHTEFVSHIRSQLTSARATSKQLSARLNTIAVPSSDLAQEIKDVSAEALRIRTLQQQLQAQKAQKEKVSSLLVQIPPTDDLKTQSETLTRMVELEQFLKKTKNTMDIQQENKVSLQSRLQESVAEIQELEALIQSIPRCPSCGRPTESDCND